MIIRLFKGILPSKLFLIALVAILCWSPIYFFELPNTQTFIIQQFSNIFVELYNILPRSTAAITMLLVVIQSVYITQINHKHILIEQRSYLPALIFTLLTLLFIKSPILISLLLINLVWLTCLDLLYSSAGPRISIKAMFNIGLLVAAGTMFHWLSILLLPVIWILSSITNRFSIRGLVVATIGFVTLSLLMIYTQFLVGDPNTIITNFQFQITQTNITLTPKISDMLPHALTSLLLITSCIKVFFSLRSKKVITRKYYYTLFITIILALPTILIEKVPIDFLYLTIVPLTFISSEYLLQSKSRWKPSILLMSMLTAVLIFWIVNLTELG